MTQTQFVIFALLAVGCFSGTRAGHWAPNFNIWGWDRRKPQLSAVAPSAKPLSRVPSLKKADTPSKPSSVNHSSSTRSASYLTKRAASHAVDKRRGTLRKKTPPAVNVARAPSRDSASDSSSDTTSFDSPSLRSLRRSADHMAPTPRQSEVEAVRPNKKKKRPNRRQKSHHLPGVTVLGNSDIFEYFAEPADDSTFQGVTLEEQVLLVGLAQYREQSMTLSGVHIRNLQNSRLGVEVMYHDENDGTGGRRRSLLVNRMIPKEWHIAEDVKFKAEDVKFTGKPPVDYDEEGEQCAEVEYNRCMAYVDLSKCGVEALLKRHKLAALWGVFTHIQEEKERLKFVLMTSLESTPLVVMPNSASAFPKHCDLKDPFPAVNKFLNLEGTDFRVKVGWTPRGEYELIEERSPKLIIQPCFAVMKTDIQYTHVSAQVDEHARLLSVTFNHSPEMVFTQEIPDGCPLERAIVREFDGSPTEDIFRIEQDTEDDSSPSLTIQPCFGVMKGQELEEFDKDYFGIEPEVYKEERLLALNLDYMRSQPRTYTQEIPDGCPLEQAFVSKFRLRSDEVVFRIEQDSALVLDEYCNTFAKPDEVVSKPYVKHRKLYWSKELVSEVPDECEVQGHFPHLTKPHASEKRYSMKLGKPKGLTVILRL